MNKQTTTPATPIAIKGKRPPTPQSRLLQQIASVWNAASTDDKQSWKALAGQMNPTHAVAARSKVGPYALFVKHALAQMKSGSSVQTTAPSVPTVPAALPGISVTATFAPDGFQLALFPAAAYPSHVIVYAAPPALAGSNIYSENSYKIIGHLRPLTLGPIDITSLYAACFRMPGVGYEAALKIVGVSPGGFRTPGLYLTGPVVPADQQAALSGDPAGDGSGGMTLLKAA